MSTKLKITLGIVSFGLTAAMMQPGLAALVVILVNAAILYGLVFFNGNP